VIGEELGFMGGLFVLAMFALILWRGLRASSRTTDEFGRLLAVGLTVMIVGQAPVNISVVLGLMPTKGIPPPLSVMAVVADGELAAIGVAQYFAAL
jgi:cell division protein FtsW